VRLASLVMAIGLATVCRWPTPNVALSGTPPRVACRTKKPRWVTPRGFLRVRRTISEQSSIDERFIIHRYFIEELTMTYRAYLFAGEHRYLNDAWRFSDARSVSAATSDRASSGGLLVKRCPTITES